MAELNTESGGGKKKKGKKVRTKKMSTRIDFTPMVDLGFLLITFFMLTTTLSKPQTMEINMPVKGPDSTKVPASSAMTVILSENDKIYYYFGLGEEGQSPKVEITNFSKDGIRKILLDKNSPQIQQIKPLKVKFQNKEISEEEFKKQSAKIKGDLNALMVLIKADDKAKYKNLIDILDEMQITNIGKYAIVDLQPAEKELIKNL